jgi:hypothetical protein
VRRSASLRRAPSDDTGIRTVPERTDRDRVRDGRGLVSYGFTNGMSSKKKGHVCGVVMVMVIEEVRAESFEAFVL